MKNIEVEILLIEDNIEEAEKAISILRKNNLADKLIHLRNGDEASDFIFCTNVFQKRNIHNQPKTILFNIADPQKKDLEFLNRVNADPRTKNISLVVFTSKTGEIYRQKSNDLVKQRMF
jgi:two-component system response regulator